MSITLEREIGTDTLRHGRTMTTSRMSPSSDDAASISACGQEEDASATVPVVVVALSVAAISIIGMISRIGSPVCCAAPTAENWGPSSSELPWDAGFSGGGVSIGFDTLKSKSRDN
jgi:hypothetical protein